MDSRHVSRKVTRTVCLLTVLFVLGPQTSLAAKMEFFNIPLLVNAYPNSTLDAAETTAAVNRMNEIYKQAKIKFTLLKRLVPGANPGDGNGSWTRDERDTVRTDGKKELDARAGKGKGVKVSVAQQPSSTNANVNGLAIIGNPVAVMRENSLGAEKTAQTMAHELGHVLGLGDLYGAGDKDRLMYGYSKDRSDTKFTAAEITTIQGNAKKFGKVEEMACPPPATPASPTVPTPHGSGGGTSFMAGPFDYQFATYSQWLDDGLSDPTLRLMLGGEVPPAIAPQNYSILLDIDNNPGTGNTINTGLGSHNGIDNVIAVQVLDPLTVDVQLFDGLGSPLGGLPATIQNLLELDSDGSLDEILDPPPTFNEVRATIDIELVALSLQSSNPIVVSGDAFVPSSVLHEYPIPYSDSIHLEGPQLASNVGEVIVTSPAVIDIFGTQYLPDEVVDIFLGDTLLLTTSADGSGDITELGVPLPSLPSSDFFFVTGLGRESEDYGFFAFLTVPEPAGGLMMLILAGGMIARRRR